MCAKIFCVAMANRDCAIRVVCILNEKRRHRLPDNVASSDNDALFSGGANSGYAEHLLYSSGCARNETIALSDEHLPHIHWMKPVDILRRVNAAHNNFGIDLRWHRHLDKNAVYLWIVVQRVDFAEQLPLLCRCGQPDRFASDARFVGSFPLRTNVRRARSIIADENHSQPRANAALYKSRGFFCYALTNSTRDSDAVNQLSGQSPPSGFRESTQP
jgi:hypothetical protein